MFERLKSHGVNLAALGFVLSIVVIFCFKHAVTQWLMAAISTSFFASIFNCWRLLKITEAPISSIAAAAQGYVELFGKASTDMLLKTSYQDIPCVWYL